MTRKWYVTLAIPRCIHTLNLEFLPKRIQEICTRLNVLFVWFDAFSPINNLSFTSGRVFLGWTSTKLGLMCLAQGHNAVPILETRSEVKVKITVTQGWYTTLHHLKMHADTKFGIPTSNNILGEWKITSRKAFLKKLEQHMYKFCLFARFGTLSPSEQFFSHIGTGLLRWTSAKQLSFYR